MATISHCPKCERDVRPFSSFDNWICDFCGHVRKNGCSQPSDTVQFWWSFAIGVVVTAIVEFVIWRLCV